MTTRSFRLDGPHDTQVWLSQDAQMPRLLYWGAHLPADEDLAALALALQAPIPQGGLDVAETVSWLPEPGRGFTDLPGLELRRGDQRLYTAFTLARTQRLDSGWCFELTDADAALALALTITVHGPSGVYSAGCQLSNTGGQPLAVDALATVCLPLPDGAQERLSIGGSWSAEFRELREPLGGAAWVQEARTGRSSHHAYPGLTLLQAGTNATQGQAWSAQIAWSGNHRIVVQGLRLGGGQWQLGELLLPGEVVLAPGASCSMAAVHLLHSAQGLRGLSAGWHRFVRDCVLPPQPAHRARRVQFNTWEATYFDHDAARLRALAALAAEVGAERFVLDDGWFGARRNDQAGLGDWWPTPALYPQGLAALADHCRSLGLEFGLWVEPEGVNTESDLYRAHPDWVLQVPGRTQPLGRHQYVLDLGRDAAREHVYQALAALLHSAPIDFLKWDMNRDFTHEAGADGRVGVRAHVLGLVQLLARLRQDYPALEIETCASGGGRADLGMLAHTRRVWVSDCNDPLARQPMQAAFLRYLPPELMGSHVGPQLSHTTGRESALALRTLTALFGHFGIEADLLSLTAAERLALRQAITVYKAARPWLQDALVTAIDSGDPAITATLASAADGCTAWVSLVATQRSLRAVPAVLRVPGLAAGRLFDVSVHALWPAPGRGLKQGGALEGAEALRLSAEALAGAGFRLPALWPGACCLLEIRAGGAADDAGSGIYTGVGRP